MKLKNYDIVRQETDQLAIWLEAVADLDIATSRIQQLTSLWPGEFCVMDQHSHCVIARGNDRLSFPVDKVEHRTAR